MAEHPTATRPVQLAYDTPKAGAVRYVGMPELALATALFFAAHWAAEYACQSYYHLAKLQPLTRQYSRALDDRDMNMVIETFWIAACSAAFLIAQGLMRPNTAAPVRPRAWLVSAVAGLALCLMRWLLWYLSRDALPEFARFVAAILLAVALAAAVSFYRFPDRNFEL